MGEHDFGFGPAATLKASQDIANQIQTSILSGKLKPGDRLPTEREMTAIFARSRPTVREALRTLEKEGLISVVGGSSGAIVCTPSAQQLHQPLRLMLAMKTISAEELFDARNMAELSIVQWAAERRRDADLDDMRENIATMKALRDSIENFIDLDRDFHEIVARAARNSVAQVLLQVLREHMRNAIFDRFMHLSKPQYKKEQDIVIETHTNITESIATNKPHEAKRYMEEHIQQFYRLNVDA